MSAIADKLRRWLGRDVAPTIRVHILLRGRIGEGWYDIDRQLKVPMGTTLGQLIDSGEERGIPLAEALARSPHLVHTLMLNGERKSMEPIAARACPNREEVDAAHQRLQHFITGSNWSDAEVRKE